MLTCKALITTGSDIWGSSTNSQSFTDPSPPSGNPGWDTAVKVDLMKKASGAAVVKIRVGIFGDKEASVLIKKVIDRHLGIS